MAAKTSQLQIRITEEQKAALKRLAAAARLTVSEYVLAQALPARHEQLAGILRSLDAPGADSRASFGELARLIGETGDADFEHVLASPPLESLGPVDRNQLAALVEQVANVRSIPAPPWVGEVPPLQRPHFVWPLASLRPHQIRVTPVAFKRRGIFFDPATRPAFSPAGRRASSSPGKNSAADAMGRLGSLNDALTSAQIKLEFYFLGGAVLFQAFHARPATAHIRALFQPTAAASAVVSAIAQREGWPPTWVRPAVKEVLDGGLPRRRYVELSNLSAFVPPLEYVLALSVARLRLGAAEGADDLRYVLRALNLSTADEALEVTGRYFTPRQLPADIGATLRTVLGG